MPTTPHHQRRKSGSSSAADLRQYSTKTVTVSDMSRPRRPGLSRRQTPVSAHKLGKSARERERDRLDAWDDDRESFPQFWYVDSPPLSLSQSPPRRSNV